jgi:hypothetical protein
MEKFEPIAVKDLGEKLYWTFNDFNKLKTETIFLIKSVLHFI